MQLKNISRVKETPPETFHKWLSSDCNYKITGKRNTSQNLVLHILELSEVFFFDVWLWHLRQDVINLVFKRVWVGESGREKLSFLIWLLVLVSFILLPPSSAWTGCIMHFLHVTSQILNMRNNFQHFSP
jgi:hypothetical protein